jgi:integrase
MSRANRGTVDYRSNPDAPGTRCWCARYTRADRTRTPWQPLDPNIPESDRASAEACAAQYAPIAKATTKGGKGESLEAYAKRWLADREGRVKSLRSDRGRLACHVLDLIGREDVRTIGRDGVERVRNDLDRKIASGELSWKTAANVWTVVTSMFDDTKNSKKVALRVREDNPCSEVRPPDRGAKKQKQYLYPSEFLAIVSCARVPLRWRRAVAVAVYTYARDGELRALAWNGGDVDLEHGALSITRAFNQNTKKIEQTKTGETRRLNIELNLLPLFKTMHAEAKGKGHVLSLAPQGNMARKLRLYLGVAGIKRPELHKGSATRKPLTWHDLRATGITWCAVRGDEPMKIMQRAGHTTFATTQGYVRTAENMRADFGDVFPPLPEGPLRIVTESSVTNQSERNSGKTRGILYRRRDSNPHALSDGGF